MKFTLFLTILFSALMMTTKATSHQKTCHPLKEVHANAVCKEYCGSVGYLLGECGEEGICVCEKRQLNE
jgi:hypothetical protein